MEIKDIKQFMDWCAEGPSTYSNRKKLFEDRKKALEEDLNTIISDNLPANIKSLCELAPS